MSEPKVLLTGLRFGESPRWHEGQLWFVDMQDRQVLAMNPDGEVTLRIPVPEGLAGIGFLPDGRLLIVSHDRRILRREADGSLVLHADLAHLSEHHFNDMVVDGRGNAYVGQLDVNFYTSTTVEAGSVVLVTPGGEVRTVATGMDLPNGVVVTPDGKTLIMAELMASRITAFDISDDGTLSNRRVWAALDKATPDGIALDAEGAVWYADPLNSACVRVAEGGKVLQTIKLDRACYACALGGPDRKTLYLITAHAAPQLLEALRALPRRGGFEVPKPADPNLPRQGQVLSVPVQVAGVGWP